MTREDAIGKLRLAYLREGYDDQEAHKLATIAVNELPIELESTVIEMTAHCRGVSALK